MSVKPLSEEDIAVYEHFKNMEHIGPFMERAFATIQRKQEQIESAVRLYALTLNNEIRWMRKHEELLKTTTEQIAALEKERDGLRAQLVQVATGGLFRLDKQEVDCDYSFGSEASCRK